MAHTCVVCGNTIMAPINSSGQGTVPICPNDVMNYRKIHGLPITGGKYEFHTYGGIFLTTSPLGIWGLIEGKKRPQGTAPVTQRSGPGTVRVPTEAEVYKFFTAPRVGNCACDIPRHQCKWHKAG